MKTIDLATDAAAVTTLESAPSAPSRLIDEPQREIRSGEFHGLSWTFRDGFDRTLTRVPAAAWTNPAERGWKRVKHNGTREVWRATIEGVGYYLKYYRRHGWAAALKEAIRGPACLTEWKGGVFALRAGIPAVRPAGFTVHAPIEGHDSALLVTEAIEPVYPLNEYWLTLQSDTDRLRRRTDAARLIEQIAEMIAHAHQAGFEHLDMHAANILVSPVSPRAYRTLFVDLQSARLGVPIDDGAVVRNLAQLNQWFRKHSTVGDRLRFLQAYLRWRNEYEHAFEHGRPIGLSFEHLVEALAEAAVRQAERISAQRDRRLHRDGRYFARIRLPGGWRGMAAVRCKHETDESRASGLVLDRSWWRARLAAPLSLLAPDRLCKDSHSAQVARTALPNENGALPVIVKRPLARNWRRRLRQLFGPSRARRAWDLGHALLHRDVATARPLAFLERRFGPLVLDSLSVTEAAPTAEDLESYLRRVGGRLSDRALYRLKRAIGAALVDQMRRLQSAGFTHRDCKVSNLLVLSQPELRLVWIDMDGIRPQRRSTLEGRLAPLCRLHVSLQGVPGLTRTDRVRLLKRFLARFGAAPDEWRSVWPLMAKMIDAKSRAHAAHREWKLSHYGRE
ncbi:MAG: lipopolysaccharide kinase InaA family protein [Phycisphaerae bacterium]